MLAAQDARSVSYSGAAQDARWGNASGAAQDARWVNVSGAAQDARCFVYPDQFHPNVAPHALEAEWREPSGESFASQHRAVGVTGPRALYGTLNPSCRL
jgi:hypothetical protein